MPGPVLGIIVTIVGKKKKVCALKKLICSQGQEDKNKTH